MLNVLLKYTYMIKLKTPSHFVQRRCLTVLPLSSSLHLSFPALSIRLLNNKVQYLSIFM